MALLLKKNQNAYSNLITDTLDSERFVRKNLLKMDEDLLPYESITRMPSANITERERDYVIELAAPGLAKRDFKVNVEHDILSVSAEKEFKKEKLKNGISHKEFSFEQFCRTFRLPENSKIDKVHANYENGILRIEIPKKTITILKPKKEIIVV